MDELPVTVDRDADWAVIHTDDVVDVLHRLTRWALERGHSLDELTVTRPTLEDVYLRLTQSPNADAAAT